ncbi:neuroligin-4, Y-linked [Anopheles nili]|uniref:neuroligin-4, Y-linked n=1 Tax=Anopheles nili TaxID=185578 RepID=UPI00237A2E30|nr:neuroligin-4, Y-linked [Anopheles nili]
MSLHSNVAAEATSTSSSSSSRSSSRVDSNKLTMLPATVLVVFAVSLVAPISSAGSGSSGSGGNGAGATGSAGGGSNMDENETLKKSTSSRIVHTKYGAVSGTIEHLDGRHLDPVEAFRGIPYASPPVGNLRFMPPVTGALWSGVKKADRFSPVCPQRLPDIYNETAALERMPRGRLEYLRRLLPYLRNQSEDCLYLNIYVPTQAGSRESSSSSKYAVVVFVHGESYAWNSGNPYDGSVLASYGQILVVTINYRLGILGFLNANVDRFSKAPANYGLMDIIAALHWIQENIEAFGGDPRSVTLAGHGTGAACVHFLIASAAVPEGLLFHRAIMMSGSGLAPWSLVGEPAKFAAYVSHHVNCSPELPHQLLLKCLRDKPLEDILSTSVRAPDFGNAFGPSVDGVVIDTGEILQMDGTHYSDYNGIPSATKPSAHIHNTLNTINAILLRKLAINKLSKYDLLVGVTRAEAYFAFNSEDVQYGIEADRRAKILKNYVRSTYSFHLNEILATIVNEYTDWERPVQHPINIRDETLEALSDARIVAPAVQTADLHSADHRNSFLYVFDYQTKFGDFPQRQGCIHGEDLPYLFGAPLVGGFNHFTRNYTKSEIALSEAVMIYWSNFIRTGNPNEQLENDHVRDRTRFKNIEWTPYESVHKKYLNLDTKPKLKNHYRAHRLSFWLNLVPDLHKPGSDDVPGAHHELEPDDEDQPGALMPTVKPLNPPQRDPASLGTNYTLLTTQVFSLLNFSSYGILPNGTRLHPGTRAGLPVAAESSEGSDDDGTGSAGPGTGAGSSSQEDGFAAYSTALSVTIAIGCSLLILNVLIFAGVYYQRDKTRLNEPRSGAGLGPGGHGTLQTKKRTENGQMPNNICGELEGLTIHAKSDPSTILGHHHPALQHHQMPPPEFADLPQRAPPPPKHLKSVPGDAGGMLPAHALQLIGGNCGTLTKKSCVKSNLAMAVGPVGHPSQNVTMDELRV